MVDEDFVQLALLWSYFWLPKAHVSVSTISNSLYGNLRYYFEFEFVCLLAFATMEFIECCFLIRCALEAFHFLLCFTDFGATY